MQRNSSEEIASPEASVLTPAPRPSGGEPGRPLSAPPAVLRRPALVLGLLGALILGAGCASSANPYQDLSADEHFRAVQAELTDEDWDGAIQAAERFLTQHPRDSRLVEVRIMLARAHYEAEEYITAAAEYERTLARYPTSNFAERAALGICESHAGLSPIPQRDQEYTELALETCQRVVTDFPGTAEARTAGEIRQQMLEKLATKLLQNGRFYQRRGLWDSAVIYYEEVVRLYPETSVAPRALLAMSTAYEEIGYAAEAQEARDRLRSLYPDSAAARSLQGGGTGTEGAGSGAL